MFSWFRGPLAQVSASGESHLTVSIEKTPLFDLDLRALDYIGFVHIGSNFSGGEHGWWLFGASSDAHAISSSCPTVETIMRGPLYAAADKVEQLQLIQRLNPVAALGRAKRHGGAVILCSTEVEDIRRGAAIEKVSSVQYFPSIS